MAPPKEAPKEQQQLITDPPPSTLNPQTNGCAPEPAAATEPAEQLGTDAASGGVPATRSALPAEIANAEAPPSGVRTKVAQVMVGKYGAHLENIDDLYRFSKMISLSGFAPKGMEKPEAIAAAVQLGLEIGLSPMSALQNIASINGRPGIFGDAAKALVEASGLMEDFDEWYEHKGQRVAIFPAQPDDTTAALCMSKRVGRKERMTAFSVADAKRASLWGKTGRQGEPTPWITYPGRMLMWRARGFNLRDNFPDVLKGLRTVEEIRDIGDLEEIPESGPIDMPKRLSESTETTAVSTS